MVSIIRIEIPRLVIIDFKFRIYVISIFKKKCEISIFQFYPPLSNRYVYVHTVTPFSFEFVREKSGKIYAEGILSWEDVAMYLNILYNHIRCV